MTVKRYSMFVFVAFVLGLCASTVSAQKVGEVDLAELAKQAGATRASITAIPAAEARWPEMLVNGKVLSPSEIARIDLYFTGDAAMLATKISVAVEKELDRRKKAGQDISKLIVPDTEIRRRTEMMEKRVEEAFPDTTFEQYLTKSGQTRASFDYALKTQAAFDAIYFPNDGNWPDASMEAAGKIRAGMDEKQRIQFINDLKAANASPDGNKQGGVLAMLLLRQQVVRFVVDPLEFKDALDGLAPEVALAVDGKEFKTSEMQKVGMGISGYVETLRAIQFATIRASVQQAILAREESDWAAAKAEAKKKRDKGENVVDPPRPVYWLAEGSPEFRDAFEAEKKLYPPGPFDHKGIVRFRKFPTMQVYRMYFQMIESFKRMSAAERTTAAIEQHVKDSMLYFSNGTADVEAIWYSYSTDPNVRSVEEGFASAKARAEKAVEDLKRGVGLAEKARKEAKEKGMNDADAEKVAIEAARGLTFSDILERDSDYKDPKPQPGQQAPVATTNRGRFGPLQRNPLNERLHENELTNLLYGYLLGEEMFFRAPIGEVVGPVRGANGYYLARVLSRTSGGKVPDLKDEKQLDLARQDCVNHAFQKFVNTTMQNSKIEIKN